MNRFINVKLQLYHGLQSSFTPRSSFAKLIAVALLAIHMSSRYNAYAVNLKKRLGVVRELSTLVELKIKRRPKSVTCF